MSGLSFSNSIFLIVAGAVAGFIDSIAGGGGLITVPSLATALHLDAGATIIGTNKIVGAVAALLALLVYLRRGQMDWIRGIAFTLWVGVGSFLGSRVAPHVPPVGFKIFLLVTCPVLLWIVWNKDLWIVQHANDPHLRLSGRELWLDPRLIGSGLACGFYDGIWGPGGGTFMLLSLFIFARLPLLTAVAASKLANTTSALVALGSYASAGHVQWIPGITIALGGACGVLVGATQASKRSVAIVRPVLLIVVVLLVARLVFSQ